MHLVGFIIRNKKSIKHSYDPHIVYLSGINVTKYCPCLSLSLSLSLSVLWPWKYHYVS